MELLSPSAYLQIFQVWFEGEGLTLEMDQLERKTLSQMKAYCERVALHDGVRIQCRIIRYKEEIKARAKAR